QHTVEKSRLEATHRSVQRGQSSLFDHSLEPMLLLDDEFRCGAANTAASLLLGRAISQLRGTEAAEFLVLGPDWSQAWARWKENGILDGVCQFVRPDGRVGDLEFSLTPRCVGKQHLMVLRDCSHRREIEERLRCGSEQWKTLAQQRQALLQQSLAAQDVLERELRLAFRDLRQSKDVATVQRRVESAVSQLRKSCGGAPAGRMGPMEALRSQARDFQERTGIQCKISSKLADRSDGESPATRFCPILEKALSNVAIHGTATMVHVRLSRESGKWILEVEDDGHSLTETQMTDAQTFRLCGVREQVLRFGGDLTLQGLPGRGTKLRVWLPGEAKTRPRRQA
ncbi:MAG: hypothetical protein FJ405_07685, partial [Verrucomicrobia bacterium]|nr:hypothetical protein [Verrucomicrobiota bacterium]